ncbi:MAG: DUF2846 domain-containing protein [Candidatus Omnitrophica bacterium]|nr:DUF2846 domain-containing protein [Candidatus Omnitrophota bacterium]
MENKRNRQRVMKKIIVIVILFFSCGCTSVSLGGINYNNAPRGFHTSNTSIIYILRENATPTAFGAKILINNKKVCALPNKGFTWVEVIPGEKMILAKWPSITGQEDSTIRINAKENETYYILLNHDRTIGGSVFSPYNMINAFVITNKSLAQNKMKDMKYFKSKRTDQVVLCQ